MKKLYPNIYWFAIIYLLSVSSLFAQNRKFDFGQPQKRLTSQQLESIIGIESIMGADVKYLPSIAKNYYWASTTNQYIYSNDELTKYNSKGDIVSETSYNVETGDSISKVLYKYNASGKETEQLHYNWQSSTWTLSSGSATTYVTDQLGRVTQEIYSDYASPTELWTNSYKSVYTYANANEQGFNTVAYFEWKDNGFVAVAKYIDVVWKNFEAQEVISYTEQDYISNSWVSSLTEMRTYSGKNFTGETQEYIDGKWIVTGKNSGTYDAIGSSTLITQVYENGNLTNDTKYLELLDVKGNDAGYQESNWENGAWVLKYSNLIANTYNINGALIESIEEYGLSGNTSKSKTVYSNFVSVATGIAEPSLDNLVSVFPIPAKDIITISRLSNESLTFKIFNSQGTEIPTNVINNSLNISDWNSGIYYLNIQSGSGQNFTKKLIKE